MPHVLIVDDDVNSLSSLRELVAAEGFSTSTATNLKEARIMLCHQRPDAVLIDLMLPDGHGTELFDDLERRESMEVILMTGHASIETAVNALRLGAADYLVKPINFKRLKAILSRVPRSGDLKEEIGSLREELRELGQFGKIIGASPVMQALYNQISRVAPTSANVFLIGESGTGKEMAAQTVHDLSRRRRGVFLPVNCGAISPHLIESEIFGHEKGSFTGADRQHKGYFERAGGGTLFLDEITEMPVEMQVKLLRVLENGLFNRIGSDKQIETDLRLIAATNREPEVAIREGKLREDLFHRLNVFPIHLPPLRDREDDVLLLASRFLESLNRQEGTRKSFSPAVIQSLRSDDWSGNVRELKNFVHRAFILSDNLIETERLPTTQQRNSEILTGTSVNDANSGMARQLPIDSGTMASKVSDIEAHQGHQISESDDRSANFAPAPLSTVSGAVDPEMLKIKIGTPLADIERTIVLATLEKCHGVKKATAKMLGVSLKTLYNRLVDYGVTEQSGLTEQTNLSEKMSTADQSTSDV